MSRKIYRKKTVEKPSEKPIAMSTITVAPKPEVKKSSLAEVVAMFPEAEIMLTQRWYGETFYPKYTEALKLLKELAK